MKKITFITLFIAISISVNAQSVFKFGITGGLNMANISGDVSNNSNVLGYNAGLMAEIKLPVKIGVEADVLYSVKGATVNDLDLKLSYIDIPLVFKIYTLKVLNFQVGPQYSILTAASFDGDDIKENFKPSEFSVVVGLGVDVLKFHAAARYNFGLTNIVENGGELKNRVIQLSIGLWIK